MLHSDQQQGANNAGTHTIDSSWRSRAAAFTSPSSLFWVCLVVTCSLVIGTRLVFAQGLPL